MLDIGWSELLLVAAVAIIVIGPKDLPKLMRTIGFYMGKVRRMAGDFQRQFNEVVAESEAEEVRKNLEAIRANMGPAPDLSQPLGQPLMTGDPVSSPKEFVEAPVSKQDEPPLPAALKSEPEETPAKKTAGKKTTKKAAKKTAVKKVAKKTTKKASKKTATKKPVKTKKVEEASSTDGEPQP